MSDAADVARVATEIYSDIVKTAYPYVDRYSNMKNALEVLARDDKSSWIQLPFHGARAKRAVGLAWLLGDRNLATALIQSKMSFLEKINDQGLEEFRRFARALSDSPGPPRV